VISEPDGLLMIKMAKPKIGLSMLYCLSKPFQDMTKQITEYGVQYIEIVDDGWHALNSQRVQRLKQIAKEHDIKYSVHAPFSDVNIASPSKPLLKAMIRRMEQSMNHALALDAYMWVFHPGTKTGISMFYPGEDWRQNLESVRLLVSMANKKSLNIALENVPEPFPFLMKSVEDFQKFYSEVDVDVGMTLDVGHANIRNEVKAFLKTFGRKIVHMHLSDNVGDNDRHLGIGFGNVDWDDFAKWTKEISFDRVMVVESVENVEKCLSKLTSLFP
jgi:sugar phosphate isomerase/epimerase